MIAFFLFVGRHYPEWGMDYSKGGMDDYVESFDTLGECQEYAEAYKKKYDIDWMEIVTIRDSNHTKPYGLKLLYLAEDIGKRKPIVWEEVKEE